MRKWDFALLTALMALWGFNFSVIKLGVLNIEPLVLTALRFILAVFPLIFFIKRPAVKWRYLIAYGVSFGVGVWGLTTLSVYAGLSTGLAALLLNMSIITSLLIAYFFLKERLRAAKVIGSGLALMGLFIIIFSKESQVTVTGLGLVLVAACCWSINGLIVKRARTPAIFAFNIWAMLFAPLPLLMLAVLLDGPQVILELPQNLNQWALFSACFQAYPTTLLGYWFWNKMIVKHGLASVAPMSLLVPVFALLAGFLFYEEPLLMAEMVAALFILTGLLIGEMPAGFFRTHQQIKRLMALRLN